MANEFMMKPYYIAAECANSFLMGIAPLRSWRVSHDCTTHWSLEKQAKNVLQSDQFYVKHSYRL